MITMTTTPTPRAKTMNDVLDLFIKDLIVGYPALGAVLSGAGIGCVGCSVGTCRLRDIVGIHNLTEPQERTLLTAIAAVIIPGQRADIPRIERKPDPIGGHKALAPPIQELVLEHVVIKRVIALLPMLAERLQAGVTPELGLAVGNALEFIREYADRFHHAKEEDILFKYFDQTSDILVAMHTEHELGRGYVRAAVAGVEKNNENAVAENMTAYGELLKEHIKKEDEILYPWMQGQMTDSQVGHLFSEFRRVDEKFGDKPEYYRSLVGKLEVLVNR